ncbi:MAG TPA: CRISPR-associated endonuclease Cas1 [bacterium]|nr:CRISPR-associated endonuclease Cas1 [bacterium]HNT67203.1 CRISPR-associated endonuclease Cas1 [bacterium]
MDTLYIVEQSAVVRRASQSLLVCRGKQVLGRASMLSLKRLVIFGSVQITTQALQGLLDEGIDVSFLRVNGKLRGRLVAAESKNNLLRLAQYERIIDQNYVLAVAKNIVSGKLSNYRRLLLRFQRNHQMDFTELQQALERILHELPGKKSLASLLGCEGQGSSVYFKAFSQMIRGDMNFTTRNRRPPKDPVNALLSLTYMMLMNELYGQVVSLGLDPYLGFLHGVVYGRPSLVLDLLEEFRPVIADRLVLMACNNQIFQSNDFKVMDNQGVYLQDEALKTFLSLYEKTMRTETNQLTPRKRLHTQAKAMSRAIVEGHIYQPGLARM